MKEDNPYKSPSVDPPADTVDQREPASRGSGVLPFVSFVIFLTIGDVATVDSSALRGRGLTREALFVGWAPWVCLIVWLVVFHWPIGARSRLATLRVVQCIPILARHAIFWVALTGEVFFLHFVSSR